MRVLQVMAGARHGGAETAFVDTCLAMSEAGVDVRAACRPAADRLTRLGDHGIPATSMRFGGPADLKTRLVLFSLIRTWRPHIVQCWMQRAAAAVPSRVPGASPLTFARVGGFYKPKYFRKAHYLSALTEGIKRHLVAGGIDAHRIRVIPNFADVEEPGAPVDRGSLATPPDAPLFLALGRLHVNKGLDVLLAAMSSLPDAWLWIAGEGPARPRLEALAAELGVAERVRFLGWRQDRAALLAACDACVFPSRREPFGAVFIQAWAACRPVVVTAAEGPREVVRDGEDALMVPVEDPSALAQAMQRVAQDPALRGSLVAAGHRRYLGEFTRDKVIDAYLRYYEAALSTQASH